MAHDKDHDPKHPENKGTGAGETAESPVAQAVDAQQKKTKGKVKGVFGKMWDAFKDGAKKAFHDVGVNAKKVGQITGILEHPDDVAGGKTEEAPHDAPHEKPHEKPHDKKDEAKAEEKKSGDKPAEEKSGSKPVITDSEGEKTDEAKGDNDEGPKAPAEGEEPTAVDPDSNGTKEESEVAEDESKTAESKKKPDNDEAPPAPVPAPVATEPEAPAPAPTAPEKPEEKGKKGDKDEKDEKPGLEKKHDDHGAHDKKEGMSNGTKATLIGTGIVAGAVVASTALVANATAEVVGGVVENGPKWLNTAGEFVRWPFRATGKFLGHTFGTPVAELKDGFTYGAEEFVGEADYEELEGWTAPWKAVKNLGRATVRNPITRTIAGAGFGALGFIGGLFIKGPIAGGVDAFSSENAPKFEMPWKRTRKPKAKKEKKPKKALKADSHGHGHGEAHGHGADAHGHAADHKDDHPKPAGDAHGHEAEHKDGHAKPAEAGHKDDHPEPAKAEHKEEHHRLAA